MITLLFLALFSDTVGMSLDQALALARHKSPTRDDAHLSEQSAQLTYLTAWRSLVPTPSTSAGFGIRWGKSPLGRDTVTQDWTLSVSANQLFFDPVALGGISRADLGRRMAALGAQAQLCQQILDVKTAYFELQKLYGLRLLATRAVAQASDNLELVRQRQRLGSATSLDVMRVELSLHQARLDL
ncbi:MAG: TolC family protein, partial [candidate division WOR-3 bacterium]